MISQNTQTDTFSAAMLRPRRKKQQDQHKPQQSCEGVEGHAWDIEIRQKNARKR